ncbi:MAG: hypothetical protein ACRDA3_13125 [Peptostreptococcaceae bacterium]
MKINSDIITEKEFDAIRQHLPLKSVLILKKLYEGKHLNLDEINQIQYALRQDYYNQLAYLDEIKFRKEDD